jgi:hypothetical protein
MAAVIRVGSVCFRLATGEELQLVGAACGGRRAAQIARVTGAWVWRGSDGVRERASLLSHGCGCVGRGAYTLRRAPVARRPRCITRKGFRAVPEYATIR